MDQNTQSMSTRSPKVEALHTMVSHVMEMDAMAWMERALDALSAGDDDTGAAAAITLSCLADALSADELTRWQAGALPSSVVRARLAAWAGVPPAAHTARTWDALLAPDATDDGDALQREERTYLAALYDELALGLEAADQLVDAGPAPLPAFVRARDALVDALSALALVRPGPTDGVPLCIGDTLLRHGLWA